MFLIACSYSETYFKVTNANRNPAKKLLHKGKQEENVACGSNIRVEDRKESSLSPLLSVFPAVYCICNWETLQSGFLKNPETKNVKKERKRCTQSGSTVVPLDSGRRQRRQGATTGWNIKYSLVSYKGLFLLESNSNWSRMTGRKLTVSKEVNFTKK